MRLRRVPGCPLIYVSRTVLLMEQPSGKSKAEFEKAEVIVLRKKKDIAFFLFIVLLSFAQVLSFSSCGANSTHPRMIFRCTPTCFA